MKRLIEKIVQESKNTPVKWIQYLMLIILFGLAFVLPIYAVQYQAKQSSGQNLKLSSEQTAVAQEEDGAAGAQSDSGAEGKTGAQPDSTAENKTETESDSTAESKTGAQSDSAAQENGKGTIVLDPGHGGFDGGMVGSSGISEKVLNLVYAKKLAALLEEEGYRVVLTRTTEDGLYDENESNKKAQDMQRRCAVIEEENPLLSVSIHQNSYPDSSVRGPQVFYYEHSAEGEKLATAIQNCMNEQLEIAKPRIQKSNGIYYILKRSASVTALVEVGFLTNPEEEVLLQDEEYQDKATKAIYDGILQYLGEG